MRCKHCGHRYPANIAALWPGGFEAPGTWWITAGVAAAVAGLMFYFEFGAWKWLPAVTAMLALFQVPGAWLACRSPAGFSPQGGTSCPNCRGENVVWPWSL